jgi:hypothetical protein
MAVSRRDFAETALTLAAGVLAGARPAAAGESTTPRAAAFEK